jgi:hypothetical protein
MHFPSPLSFEMPFQSLPQLVVHTKLYLVKNTIYEALRYTTSSNLLSLYVSLVQIIFSAPCSLTPSTGQAAKNIINHTNLECGTHIQTVSPFTNYNLSEEWCLLGCYAVWLL